MRPPWEIILWYRTARQLVGYSWRTRCQATQSKAVTAGAMCKQQRKGSDNKKCDHDRDSSPDPLRQTALAQVPDNCRHGDGTEHRTKRHRGYVAVQNASGASSYHRVEHTRDDRCSKRGSPPSQRLSGEDRGGKPGE